MEATTCGNLIHKVVFQSTVTKQTFQYKVLLQLDSWGKITLGLFFTSFHLVFFVCSVVLDCATEWTVAHEAPLPVEFSRQGYWGGVAFPTPGDLVVQESTPPLLCLLHSHADCLPLAPPRTPLFTPYLRMNSGSVIQLSKTTNNI